MADIPPFHAVRCPGSAGVGHLVDEHFRAGWRHRRSIEVEGAIEMGFGG